MTLDLNRMASQIEAMAAHMSEATAGGRLRLARAQSRYDQEKQDLGPLRDKLLASRGKVTWMPAGLPEDWNDTYPLPPLPADFAVLASDGSQIELERHAPASCYLINIGLASLHYGRQPDAQLSSQAALFYQPEDLVLTDPANANQFERVDGKLLKLKRSVMEAQALAELALSSPQRRRERGEDVPILSSLRPPRLCGETGSAPDLAPAPALTPLPTLALMDGTLILWDMGGKDVRDFIRDQFLGPFREALERLHQAPSLALASYISNPRAAEVVDALRIAECPYTPSNCDRHCRQVSASQVRPCDAVGKGVRDADLFRVRLAPGERSPLFESNSRVLEYYGEHKVYFFYVNAGEEIARIEAPRWVASDPRRLDIAHALALDQIGRGQGYPVALTEAHEQAVVRAADREAFWALVEDVLAGGRLPTGVSAKAQSKRTRGL